MSKNSTCDTQRTLFVGWRLSRTWRPLYVYTFALNTLPVAALAGLDHGAMLRPRHKTWMSDSSAVGVNTCTCLFIVHYVHMSLITAHFFCSHPDPFGWAAPAARARGDTFYVNACARSFTGKQCFLLGSAGPPALVTLSMASSSSSWWTSSPDSGHGSSSSSSPFSTSSGVN